MEKNNNNNNNNEKLKDVKIQKMSLIKDYSGPKRYNLFKITLEVLEKLGGSGRIDEISEKIIDVLNLTEETIDYPHGDSDRSYQTELEYQFAWVRTMLKHLGLINNTKRGVWVLTQKAKEIDWDNNSIAKKYREYLKYQKEKKQKSKNGIDTVVTHDPEFIEDIYEDEKDLDWKQKLKEILIGMNPYGFEKLAQIILRECGFMEVDVTKKSGDGGFDGKGILRLNNLVSIPVIFECKRYKDPVGADKIRNFRGSMHGRSNKGLFLTTSTFTRDAKEEAAREGADLIDLLDGEKVIDLLKELELGVSVKKVEKVEIDQEWFENL